MWNFRSDGALPGDEAGVSLPLEAGDTPRALAELAVLACLPDTLGGAGSGVEVSALLNFSSVSLRAAASCLSSRNSAPGDVALTSGTPPAFPRAGLEIVGKLYWLTDRGLRILCFAADPAVPTGSSAPSPPTRTL